MKSEKVQAYVTKATKEKIVKIANEQERSESYVAGKILDIALISKQDEKQKKR